MNSEPAHFPTVMKHGKAFPSSDDMEGSQCPDELQLLPPGHWQAKRHILFFLRPSKTQFIRK